MLVGENNSGKSTLLAALTRLFSVARNTTSGIPASDHPQSIPTPMELTAELELDQVDIDAVLGPLLTNRLGPAVFVPWLESSWRTISIGFASTQPGSAHSWMDWGGLHFAVDGRVSWANYEGPEPLRDLLQAIGADISAGMSQQFLQAFVPVSDFRVRTSLSASGSMSSWSGASTASALFNLKNHADRKERDRYQRILAAFKLFFPSVELDVVQPNPGDNSSNVLFSDPAHDGQIPISNMGAGLEQLLAALVSLVGQRNLIIFWEHPELHLHPHAVRVFRALLQDASSANQVIVTTHDPHFIAADRPQEIRRVWATQSGGSRVFGPVDLDERRRAQIRTVWRRADNREIAFARATILVEDETQSEFVRAVAPALGVNLDTSGISVIPVGGEDGYRPMETVLQALGVPYVALRDRDWAEASEYPPDRFFSFGMEIEQFLDEHGLKDRRLAIMKQLGNSKARAAGPLGESLQANEIPEIFTDLLQAAVWIATGEPISGSG